MNPESVTVYLVRHGHSQQNKIVETVDIPGLLLKRNADLPLSKLGETQCENFNSKLDAIIDLSSKFVTPEKLQPAIDFASERFSWLFASSPLHRALQTTKLCFMPFASQIHVLDEASELPMWFKNRPSQTLERLSTELSTPLQREAHIPDPTGDPARDFLLALLQLHRRYPLKTIVCTTHSLLIRKLANAPFTSADPRLKTHLVPNCGILRLDITVDGAPGEKANIGVKMQQVPLLTNDRSFHYETKLARNILLYNNTAVAVFLALLNHRSILQSINLKTPARA